MTKNSRHSCALVTGASSGLGEEFARQLAPRVDKLVLVARRQDRLEHLADIIRNRHPHCAVAVFACDLTRSTERDSLVSELAERGWSPDLLVNNAGIGDYGEFITADWPRIEGMLDLNIAALTHLSHALAPEMARRGHGAILNLSSLAGELPIPDFAVYAATKAYVTSFSEALRIELREFGVTVTAICPGPVRTEFGAASRRSKDGPGMPAHPAFYVDPQLVVELALRALDRGPAKVFPGWKIGACALVLGVLPMAVLRFGMGFRPRRGPKPG